MAASSDQSSLSPRLDATTPDQPKQEKKSSNRSSAQTRNKNADEEIEAQLFLAEYEALHAEIRSRATNQTQLQSIGIALLGGIAAAAPFLLFSNAQTLRIPLNYLVTGLLIIAALFTSILWAFVDHEFRIAMIRLYTHTQLRTRAAYLLKADVENLSVLNWEGYRSRFLRLQINSFKSLPLLLLALTRGISRYAVTAVPAALALIAASLINFFNFPFPPADGIGWFNIGFLIADMLYFVGIIGFGIYNQHIFQGILKNR